MTTLSYLLCNLNTPGTRLYPFVNPCIELIYVSPFRRHMRITSLSGGQRVHWILKPHTKPETPKHRACVLAHECTGQPPPLLPSHLPRPHAHHVPVLLVEAQGGGGQPVRHQVHPQ